MEIVNNKKRKIDIDMEWTKDITKTDIEEQNELYEKKNEEVYKIIKYFFPNFLKEKSIYYYFNKNVNNKIEYLHSFFYKLFLKKSSGTYLLSVKEKNKSIYSNISFQNNINKNDN